MHLAKLSRKTDLLSLKHCFSFPGVILGENGDTVLGVWFGFGGGFFQIRISPVSVAG